MTEMALSNAITGTLLALVVFGITRIFRKPLLAHTLWTLVLLKLLLPPLSSTTLPLPSFVQTARPREEVRPVRLPTTVLTDSKARSSRGPSEAVQAAVNTEAFADSIGAFPLGSEQVHQLEWSTVLLAIWCCGSAALAMVTVYRLYMFRRFLRSTSGPDAELHAWAVEMANRLGLTAAPLVRIIDARVSPMVWGLGVRPCVLIPRELLGQLDRDETRMLLAHEFAHIKRGDHFVRWLELLTTTLYWWLPVVWWARRCIRNAEEECCDGLVLSVLPSHARNYVSTLLQTVDFLLDSRTPLPATASGLGNTQTLRRRCEMIMQRSYGPLTWVSRASQWAIALAVLPFAVGLPSPNAATAQTRSTGTATERPASSNRGTVRSAAAETEPTSSSTVRSSSTSVRGPLNAANANSPSADDTGSNQPFPSQQLDAETTLYLGDLRVTVKELLSLSGFTTRKPNTSVFGGVSNRIVSVDESALNPVDAKSGTFLYDGESRAFSEVSYSKPKGHPSYFSFQVDGKYDGYSARRRLREQLVEAIGKPHRRSARHFTGEVWLRRVTLTDADVVLEFKLRDVELSQQLKLSVIVRYEADW